MADVLISELRAADAVAGADEFLVQQDGETKRVTKTAVDLPVEITESEYSTGAITRDTKFYTSGGKITLGAGSRGLRVTVFNTGEDAATVVYDTNTWTVKKCETFSYFDTWALDSADTNAAIQTNAAAIAANKTSIETNASAIQTNAAAIAANKTSIETNAADIKTNAAAIAANKTSIETNASAIQTNAENIAINTAAIAALSGDSGASARCLNEVFAAVCGNADYANGANGKEVATYIHDNITTQGRFDLLRDGDYINFPSLSVAAVTVTDNAGTSVTVPAVSFEYDETYAMPRLEYCGDDPYYGYGDTEITEHHGGWCFYNALTGFTHKMNSTNSNLGGYPSSIIKKWLNSDGFQAGITAMLGFSPLTVHRYLQGNASGASWNTSTDSNNTVWAAEKTFLLTIEELTGSAGDNRYTADMRGCRAQGTSRQWRLFGKQPSRLIKRRNGSRYYYWTASPAFNYTQSSTACFCTVHGNGDAPMHIATNADAVVPALAF